MLGGSPAAAAPTPSTASDERRASAPASSGDKAVIGTSITVKGELTGDEDLVIQGKVEGSIHLKDHAVTIGRTGRVKADVHAKNIYVQGEVTGDLFGGDQVIVQRSGIVRGNITAPRVTLEDGAKLKGTIDMDPKPEQRSFGADNGVDKNRGQQNRVGSEAPTV